MKSAVSVLITANHGSCNTSRPKISAQNILLPAITKLRKVTSIACVYLANSFNPNKKLQCIANLKHNRKKRSLSSFSYTQRIHFRFSAHVPLLFKGL